MKIRPMAAFLAAVTVLCLSGEAYAKKIHPETGFLVVAPDRGFLGNERTRDAFNGFAGEYTAELAFVTKEKATENIHVAIERLESRGVKGIWVLPLFLSPSNVKYGKAEEAISRYVAKVPVRVAETMNESYLTEEILRQRAAKLSKTPSKEVLVVIASGAVDRESEKGIREDVGKIVEKVKRRLRFKETEVAVLYSREADEDIAKEAMTRAMDRVAVSTSKAERVIVVPFNFSMEFTNMMSSWNRIKKRVSKYDGTVFDGKGVTPHMNVELWLKKKANERLPLSDDEIGIVFMPHGSDYNWNETMRESIRPLTEKYKVEYAFSMADPMIVKRAIEKLEERGCRAIVVLRVFSLEASFRDKTDYMLGLKDRVKNPPMRISSKSVMVALGGVEDHPLLAEALYDRAMALSRKPGKETVILLAHGTDDDDRNRNWLDNLGSLAEQIRKNGGSGFRNIKYHTWREDWPDKREKAVEVIRKMIKEAISDGGTAIVVPARTAGRGHGDKFLDDLDFLYAEGFAPHPNFIRWVEEKIKEGIKALRRGVEEKEFSLAGSTKDARMVSK